MTPKASSQGAETVYVQSTEAINPEQMIALSVNRREEIAEFYHVYSFNFNPFSPAFFRL